MDIKDIRAKYPQYADIPDEKLLQGLHAKFYSDMPYDQFASKITGVNAQPQQVQHPEGSTIGNLIGGAFSGAGQIGSTLLAPVDWALKKAGLENENFDRRKEIEVGLRNMGVNPESGAFKIGEIGAEIAGTGGVGGVLAKGASKLGADKIAQALRTGGFGEQAGRNKIENAALKLGGGAASGGAAAALVNPDEAEKGAAIGAIVPAGAKVLGTAAREILGGTTGVGGKAIAEALRAGKEGNQAFIKNMSGDVQMTDVLEQAKSALNNIRQARGAEYRAGMEAVGKSDQPIAFGPIDRAVNDAMSVKSYKGISTSRSTQDIQNKISDVVNEWRGLDPAQYHTAEGLDALKQSVGDLRDSTQFGTPERKVADSVYHAIKGEIVKAAPEYAKTMKDYEQASGLIGEIEKALSLGNKASADTAMRKLQSLTRDNVNTNYGNRLRLAEELRTKGGEDIIPALSGQAMSSWMPRGMARTTDMGLAGMAALMNPSALVVAPIASPRLVGTAAYGAGKASAGANKLADMLRAATKSGITNDEINAALLRAGIAGTQ